MKNIFKVIVLTAIIALTSEACKKDNKDVAKPNVPNEETELITTVKLEFVDTTSDATGPVLYAVFRDMDGPGGNPPSAFDTIKLSANKVYRVKLLLLDESKTPADTTSNEVMEEAADHQFFFHPSGTNTTVKYDDMDKNSLPVGLTTLWNTGAAATGTMKVVLKHQPGIKKGSQADGETDVEIDFPAIIK